MTMAMIHKSCDKDQCTKSKQIGHIWKNIFHLLASQNIVSIRLPQTESKFYHNQIKESLIRWQSYFILRINCGNNVTTRSSTKICCLCLLRLVQVKRAEAFYSKRRTDTLLFLLLERSSPFQIFSHLSFSSIITLLILGNVFYQSMYSLITYQKSATGR